MENKKSLLITKEIKITSDIKILIPTVGQVLKDEKDYYDIVRQITASPYSMMVQLDDIGIDFEKIDDFDLFNLYSRIIFSSDLSLIFGNTFSKLYNVLSDENISNEEKEQSLILVKKKENNETCLYDIPDDILIDRYIYEKIANALRSINLFEKDNRTIGADKEYFIKKNRRLQLRHKNDEYKPFLENLVVALVNKQEFKYNYEETMKLSIYNFNRSVKQIKHTVSFDKVMNGVYAGTVDTSKLTDKSILSFIETK